MMTVGFWQHNNAERSSNTSSAAKFGRRHWPRRRSSSELTHPHRACVSFRIIATIFHATWFLSSTLQQWDPRCRPPFTWFTAQRSTVKLSSFQGLSVPHAKKDIFFENMPAFESSLSMGRAWYDKPTSDCTHWATLNDFRGWLLRFRKEVHPGMGNFFLLILCD